MAQKPSEGYTAFDALMGDLLKVSKPELDAKVQAHKERAALNPNKRGPKRKVSSAQASASDASRDAS